MNFQVSAKGMISQESITKRLTSVIYVFREINPILTLEQRNIAAILNDPEIAAQGNAIVVSSMPAQFQMLITPPRIEFRDRSDQSPARSDFTKHVSVLTNMLSEDHGLTYSAFGLNFDVVFEIDNETKPASEVISDRFINSDSFSSSGYDLIGASVRLWYMARDIRHYLFVQPQGDSPESLKYQAHINVHYELDRETPDSKELEKSIKTEYEDFREVLFKILP